MIYLCLLLGFVFFAGVAMTVNEGLWNNTIALFAIILSGLVAGPWGSVVGGIIGATSGVSAENMWAFVFAGVWGVFVATILIFRAIAGRISQVRIRFVKPIDMIAGPLTGLLVAVMFTSFVAVTLWIPITNDQWKVKGAASWQLSTFQYSSAPFANVLGRFYFGRVIHPDDLQTSDE